MALNYRGTRDVKKEHYQLGILLTEDKKKEILKKHFLKRVGYELNLDNPKSFNEKVMWSKLYYQNPLITKCCDKFAVKEYVTEVIGEQYTVPNLAVWDDPDQIDFDTLPNQFALKVNWSSGYNIICHDKETLDIEDTKRKLKHWMQPDRNSYYQFFNWGFKHMKPVVYAEQYLEQIDGQVYDYKFFTFNGKVRFWFIATQRYGNEKLTHDFYDMDFQHLDFDYGGRVHSKQELQKPRFFDEMVQCAEKLAKPFPFVRVDFYETDNKFYVGEMTFYPGGGILPFDPVEWDYKIGEWYELPEKMITDKTGPFYETRVAAAKTGRNMKKSFTKVRRKVVKHDIKAKQHYVTLFNSIRFPLAVHKEAGQQYVTLSGMQVRYKKAPKIAVKTQLLAAPKFTPLSPMQAYMMEDKITLDMKKHYCEQKAYAQLQYFPNLDDPKSFNEKLLWLALYYKNPHHKVASDKARAKAWISERIGEEYVVPMIGAYSNVNDIDFDALPDKFVIKANEGWGADEVILVHGKSQYDIDRIKAHASSWLYPWSSYYYNNMCITDEKPQRPMVVIEEYLEHEGSKYLDDYKFYCCNGEVKFALIVKERGSKNQSRTFVDSDWNVLPVRRAGKFSNTVPKKPENLDKMFEIARTLCKEVPFVRIDFYNLDGKIYVGEMTFTPGMFLRFEPREWDYKLGEYLDLTEVMKEVQQRKEF